MDSKSSYLLKPPEADACWAAPKGEEKAGVALKPAPPDPPPAVPKPGLLPNAGADPNPGAPPNAGLPPNPGLDPNPGHRT